MWVAGIIAQRSTCLKRKVGAVIAYKGHIVGMGYNGAPKGREHCLDVGCLLDDLGNCRRAIHAEDNAYTHRCLGGLGDHDLFTTSFPCVTCANRAITLGAQRIFYAESYNDPLSLGVIESSGVQLIHLPIPAELGISLRWPQNV